MSTPPEPIRDLGLVHRPRDEDEDEELMQAARVGPDAPAVQLHAAGARQSCNVLIVLTVIRSAQLPALVWASALIIAGPIAQARHRRAAVGGASATPCSRC